MQRCGGRQHQQLQRSETAELLRRYAMTTKARVFRGRCLPFIRLPNEARGEKKINGGGSKSVSRRNSIRRRRIRTLLPFGNNRKARIFLGRCLPFTRLPNKARGERKINGGGSTSVSRRNSIRRRQIWTPFTFGTNWKARTGGGGALAFTGDRIKRSIRFDDRRAEKKDATRLVSSTTIEYRRDHTISAKSMYTRDNTY